MHVHFTQIKERVTAAPGDSLLVKVLPCAISVVKADCVQGRAVTNHVQRDKYLCGYQPHKYLSLGITFLLSCMFGKIILPRLIVSQQGYAS